MKVRVLYFGAVREATAVGEEVVETRDGACAGAVRDSLAARIPALAALLERSAIAVNQVYVSPDHVLADGDEIAILPPVSGGAVPFV